MSERAPQIDDVRALFSRLAPASPLRRLHDADPGGEATGLAHGSYGGGAMLFRPRTSDEDVLHHSFQNDIFFPAVPEYRPGPQDVIIDVGAHIGTFSALAASKAPGGSIYAIEASEESYALLNANTQVNALANVHTFHCALSHRRGTARLHHDIAAGNWGHSLTRRFSEAGEKVCTDTFPHFMAANGISRCDFLKMNCEGSEFDILLSTPPKVLQHVDTMLVLYHLDLVDGHAESELTGLLLHAGFTLSLKNVDANRQRGWIVARRASPTDSDDVLWYAAGGDYQEASARLREGDKQRAIEVLGRILRNEPAHEFALNDLGVLAFSGGDAAQAFEIFSTAHRVNPFNLNVLLNLRDTCLALGKTGDAWAACGAILDLLPLEQQNLLTLGRLCETVRTPEEALACYRLLLSVNPGHEEARSAAAALARAPRSPATSPHSQDAPAPAVENRDKFAAWDAQLMPVLQPIVRQTLRYLPPAGVLVDVGANTGVFVEEVLKCRDCTTYAFEPVPEYARRCAERLAGRTNVHVVPAALSDAYGKVDLWMDTDNLGWNTMIRSKKEEQMHPIVACAVRFDDYAEQYGVNRIDVIKIDVEGAEFRVLRGMRRTLERLAVKPVILLEIGWGPGGHPHWTEEIEELEWLFSHGYERVDCTVEGTRDILLLPAASAPAEPAPAVAPLTLGIPTRDRTASLFSLLQSVQRQTLRPAELLISDDGTAPDLEEAVRKACPGLQFRYLKGPAVNLPANRQHILDHASYELVMMCDDDHTLDPRCVEELYRTITMDRSIGIVSAVWPHQGEAVIDFEAKQHERDFSVSLADVSEDAPYLWTNGHRTFSTLHEPDRIIEAEFAGGGCLIYRRSAIHTSGDFPAGYGPVAFREDTDMSHRVYLHGFRVLIATRAVAYHHCCPTGGCRVDDPAGILKERDGLLFLSRLAGWRKGGAAPGQKPVGFDGMPDFSQQGEQEIIEHFFASMMMPFAPFLVEAGAYDGCTGSNTRALLEKGWGGLLIEPSPVTFPHLARRYDGNPRVRCLQLAVSDQEAPSMTMFLAEGPENTPGAERWKYAQMSTLNSHFAEWAQDEFSYKYSCAQVEVTTLNILFRKWEVPKHFGYLAIDCEGEDLRVLQGLDLDAFRPLLISVECDDRNRAIYTAYLARFGYMEWAHSPSNGFFALAS